MKLYHVRLKTGEDLLGLMKEHDNSKVTIEFPFQIFVGSDGWYAKPFGSGLSDLDEITFFTTDTYMISEASDYGYSIYQEIVNEETDNYESVTIH